MTPKKKKKKGIFLSLKAPEEEAACRAQQGTLLLPSHAQGRDLLLPAELPGAQAGVAIPGGPQPLYREVLAAAAGSTAGKRAVT